MTTVRSIEGDAGLDDRGLEPDRSSGPRWCGVGSQPAGVRRRVAQVRYRRHSPFLPWIYDQPLWTMFSVTLMVLTIYALAAHGGRRDPWV